MSESRRIEPTRRRLAQARRQGQAPAPGDLISAALLLAAATALCNFGSRMAQGLQELWPRTLLAALAPSSAATATIAAKLIVPALAWLSVALLSVLLLVLAVHRLQRGSWFSRSVAPSCQPFASALRQSVVQGCKTLFVLAYVGFVLRQGAADLVQLPARQAEDAAFGAVHWVVEACLHLTLALGAWALLEQGVHRWRYLRALRMTPQEARHEQREQRGHPLHRRLRQRS